MSFSHIAVSTSKEMYEIFSLIRSRNSDQVFIGRKQTFELLPEHRFIPECKDLDTFLSLRYFRCKRSADKSNIQWREITFPKNNLSLRYSF